MPVRRDHIFRKAAWAMWKYPQLTLEQAFLGFWYSRHISKNPPGYYRVLSRINRYKPTGEDEVDEETLIKMITLAEKYPSPWPIRKDDPTYCRVCFRVKIFVRLRCRHCYDEDQDLLRQHHVKDRKCGVPGCEEPHLSMGRCRRHYQQAYRRGELWRPAAEHDEPINYRYLYYPS